MRNIWLLVIMMAVCCRAGATQAITVAAAADLNYALRDLASHFETDSGIKVVLSFGSSGNLYSQIQNGAPFDLFFSADEDYPKKLAAAGAVDAASMRIYAIGHLVLWVPQGSTLDPEKSHMEVLTDPSVKRIAIANPQHAPYGRAAVAALDHYGLKSRVANKLVLGENVSQAAQFVQSGNAQAGLIALSLAESPAMKAAGKFWVLPSDTYPELKQGAVIISASKRKKEAQAFLDLVLSPKGAAVLQKFGFTPPVKQ